MRSFTLSIVFAGLLFAAPNALSQNRYGHVDFETSCQAEIEPTFNEAVALLHHMMYEHAQALFEDASAADPDCAMAQWGIAMSQLHPLWAPPTSGEMERGKTASAVAKEMGGSTTRESAYIEAIGAFFHTEGGFEERLAAWDAAQARVYGSNRDDVDAAAFHGLARLATAPRDDRTFSRNVDVGALLEERLEEHPEHPGLFHYIIHAYDNPVLAERAVAVARGYDQLAPEVPHALHMPSHIFVRLGFWDDVVSWNRRSADAALQHPVNGMTSMHYPHAIDYLVYGRLQQGRDDAAEAAVREVLDKARYQPHLGTAYGLAAPPARVALERRDWEAAAELPIRMPEVFPWADFPAGESITWFAKGLGSARMGDVEAARAAVDRLDAFHQALLDAGETYWAVQTDAQRRAIDAWIAFADDRSNEALTAMREAADLEDSVDKHPVTPSSVLPTRELLGEMLLLLERPDQALEAFEAALAVSPGRLNSLTGAGRAAEMSGDAAAAARYYERVADLLGGTADVDRPRVAHARAFTNDE